jgi:hypothetical protein
MGGLPLHSLNLNITPCFLSYVQYHTRHVHVKYHTYFFILVFSMKLPKFRFW